MNHFLKQEKYKAGVNYNTQETRALVNEIKVRTTDEADLYLAEKSHLKEKPLAEKKRMMASGELHVHLVYSNQLQTKIKRAREILSSKKPALTDTELRECLLDDFLKRKDPLQKAERSESKSRRKRDIRHAAEPQRSELNVQTAAANTRTLQREENVGASIACRSITCSPLHLPARTS